MGGCSDTLDLEALIVLMREKLIDEMELLRKQMMKIGMECGLDHPDVILYSQKIDELHNVLLKIDRQDCPSDSISLHLKERG